MTRVRGLRFESDELYMRLEAAERRERELRWTYEIFYDDGDSVVMGRKIASTSEESRFDQDCGL